MNRIIVRPDRLDLDSPGRRDYQVALEHDSVWGDHLIPLTVWVGPEASDDRGLVALVAGVDGVIVAQAWGAAVQQGQHIAIVGRLEQWSS